MRRSSANLLASTALFLLLVLAGNFIAWTHSAPPNNEAVWVETLHNWLDVAYSESKTFAGFGDLGPEHLIPTNLYSTFGVAHVLHYLEVEVDNPKPIGEQINSLLNEEGAYDCPLNNAPLIFETYWAVTTLQILGIPPQDPERTANFVLSLQGEDSLFHFDRIIEDTLWENIDCSNIVLIILHSLGKKYLQQAELALHQVTERVTEVVDEVIRSVDGDWHKLGEEEVWHLKSALKLLAQLNPEKVPEEGKAALAHYLTEIPTAPVDFLTLSHINDLLDTAEVVGLIEVDEIPTLPGLTEYLLQHISPEIEELGGYGWRRRWAGRLDPVMTWPTVRLFSRAGLPYPFRDLLLQTIDKYHKKKGWITFTIPGPSVDFTFFGLAIAQGVGWENYNVEKMMAYAHSVLQDPQVNVHDLYWAAKLAAQLGGERKEELAPMLQSAIARVCESNFEEEGYWLVLLLHEFQLSSLPSAVQLLQQKAEESATALSTAPRMLLIRHLVFIQEILGEQWVSDDLLKAMIWYLKAEKGGFKASPLSQGPDLNSTRWALEALTALHALDEVDVEATISFVLSCQEGYGYAWAPPEGVLVSSEPDFYSTYVGMSMLKLLRSF